MITSYIVNRVINAQVSLSRRTCKKSFSLNIAICITWMRGWTDFYNSEIPIVHRKQKNYVAVSFSFGKRKKQRKKREAREIYIKSCNILAHTIPCTAITDSLLGSSRIKKSKSMLQQLHVMIVCIIQRLRPESMTPCPSLVKSLYVHLILQESVVSYSSWGSFSLRLPKTPAHSPFLGLRFGTLGDKSINI